MDALLDRIGRDTRTARLVEAGEYPEALEWLQKTIRGHAWNSSTLVGAVRAMGDKQTETNRLRGEAYVALETMIAKVVAND